MKKKKFDCVEMQHRGGLKVHERLKNMSPKQQAEFWKRRSEALAERQRRMREERPHARA